MALCRDPKTGKVESIPGNSCPAGWTTISTGAMPAEQSQISTNQPQLPAQADTRPVVTSMKPPRPGLRPEPYAVSNVYTERQNFNTMRVTDPQRYARIVEEMRRTPLLGDRANSQSSIDTAYNNLLKAAAGSAAEGMPVTPQEARNILLGADDGGDGTGTGGRGRGGGRAPAYDGPVESITKLAESDIRALADNVAIEILGRGATAEEIEKITRRMRKAEMQQPDVRTQQGPGRTITEQGLSSQGREDILRDVLSKNPDFQQYQLDTTVMDAMVNFVNKKKAVAGD